MRISLTTRVVAIVVLLAVGIVFLDALLTRRAFESRFFAYVAEQEREQLEALADRVGAQHRLDGNLDALADPATLRQLVRRALAAPGTGLDRSPPPSPALSPEPHREPRTPAPRGLGDDRHAHPAADGRRPHRRPDDRRIAMFLGRLGIVAADGRVIMAPRAPASPAAAPLREQVSVDGRVVAELSLIPVREFARDRDRRFSNDHLRTIWWIAGAAALVASLVGWALARRLVAPLREVAAGARALADGDYDVELDARRRDEIGDLAKDFNRLARTLAATTEARERWVADTAHELRTPLAVLRGELEALRDGVRPLDQTALASLDDEVGRLSRLVEDLHALTLADVGALSYGFASVDVCARVDAACERFRDRLAERGLELRWRAPDAEMRAQIDPERFDQMLANVLENSLRYTDPPGPVAISLKLRGDAIVIRMEDGPPGVPDDALEHLFERFQRIETSRSRAHGGAGLGLAISERIARAHGGSMRALISGLGGLAIEISIPSDARTPGGAA